MRIDSSGNVQLAGNIGLGGATPTTSGTGITFPASASASTNANTLDDYEEGTFTPVIVGTTTEGTGTYLHQVGSYTKIGNRVFMQISLQWTAHTGTGAFRINGLPFTAKNTSSDFASLNIYISEVTLAASCFPMPFILPNTAHIFINQSAVGGSGASGVTIDGSGQFIIAGHYNV
jgi:hypothetical protein